LIIFSFPNLYFSCVLCCHPSIEQINASDFYPVRTLTVQRLSCLGFSVAMRKLKKKQRCKVSFFLKLDFYLRNCYMPMSTTYHTGKVPSCYKQFKFLLLDGSGAYSTCHCKQLFSINHFFFALSTSHISVSLSLQEEA
jgi:hypothetical protein